MESIIEKCRKASCIICYGAGVYAGHIATFLQDKMVKISRFGVTSIDHETEKFFGVPVEKISNIAEFNPDGLYIVATRESLHSEMISLLREYGIKNIITISDAFIENLVNDKQHDWNYFLNNIIYNYPSNEIEGFNIVYEERINILLKTYEYIEIRFSMEWHITELVDQYIYYKENFPEDYGRFVLLFPWRTRGGKPFCQEIVHGVNRYIRYKCRGKNFELITSENISFWKYFIKKYPEKFIDKRDRFIGKKISTFHVDMMRLGHFGKRGKMYIDFTQAEIDKGERKLNEWELNKPYVCLFARDGAYYYEFNERAPYVKTMDKYRTSDVSRLQSTCDYLGSFGIKCVRMGIVSNQIFKHVNCLEYVNNLHDPFMDVYLNANCMFYLGDDSGALSIAGLFDKPIAVINYPSIASYEIETIFLWFFDRDLVIYQKYWNVNKQRYLTLREMIEFEINVIPQRDKFDYDVSMIYKTYQANGIVPVKNTAEEILDLAQEMYERVMGIAKYDSLDEVLQNRFQEMAEKVGRCPGRCHPPMRVGRQFLRKNQWLFD